MRITPPLVILACASAFSAKAFAQDSVSKLNALPGDAVDAHAPAEQINNFVVDLTAISSSYGKTFGVAPLLKLSQQRNVIPLFFTGSTSAQAMSRRIKSGVPFLRPSYDYWNAPGFGVNDIAARNDPGTAISTTGVVGYQFAVATAEFALGDPASVQLGNILGGVVNFTDARPSRLFVSRVVAGTNGDSDSCSLAAVAMGAVDEDGNLAFRADGFQTAGACGIYNPIPATPNQNLFTVDLTLRAAGSLNVLSDSFPIGGDVGACQRVQNNAYLLAPGVVTNVPNLIPESIAGRRIVIGSTSNKEYLFEQTAGSILTQPVGAHLAAGLTDHRGSVAYTIHNFPALFVGSATGTAGMLGVVGGTKAFALWGLDANGGNVGSLSATLPAVITDPVQPTWSNTNVNANYQFDHYHSQTLQRGGTSPVALGRDNAGNLLAAGVVYYGYATSVAAPYNLYPNNYIAVARIDPNTGVATWSVAAWTQEGGTAVSDGKTIFQNGTTPIGRLRAFSATSGPVLSAPMIDSYGNVWFLGAHELASDPGNVRMGLFRAVYDAPTFSYTLELVLREKQVFAGRNSGRNYQISFIELNDNDSISSGAAWSGNISGAADRNANPGTLTADSPRTLGGIVIAATIVYDNDNDGQYVVNVAPAPVPPATFPPAGMHLGPDEDYKVLLYVGASADCNGNGIPDDAEIAEGLVQDTNGNGVPDTCEGIIGVPFCFGDGSSVPCPCGNAGLPGRGCANSTAGSVGARLLAAGVASVTADTVVLTAQDITGPGLFYQGTGPSDIPFGDGKLCAAVGIIRLGVVFPTAGSASYPGGLTPNPVHIQGLVPGSGGVRHYQTWYRDALPFCTSATFNLTQGLTLTWVP